VQATRSLIIDDEPISAMTLVCAALDVLAGVSRSRGLKTWLEQGVVSHGEGVNIAQRAVRLQYNFLKHSNKDPDRQLGKLSPDMVMVLIYGAIHDYEQLYGCLSTEMMLMRMWALARISALRDEPEHAMLHSTLAGLFDHPGSKSFSDARTGAVGFLIWCERNPDEVAEKLFGAPPHPRRCQHCGPVEDQLLK
jgi:hypothetical protein